jgi:hypothetical protein
LPSVARVMVKVRRGKLPVTSSPALQCEPFVQASKITAPSEAPHVIKKWRRAAPGKTPAGDRVTRLSIQGPSDVFDELAKKSRSNPEHDGDHQAKHQEAHGNETRGQKPVLLRALSVKVGGLHKHPC